MTDRDPPPGHYVMGCIHELLPVDPSPAALLPLLRHESDRCDGARVLIDLGEHEHIDDRHIDAIVDIVAPGGERWSIALPADTDPEMLDRLRRAGYRLVERTPI